MRQKGQVLSIRLLIILLFARALFLLQYLNCKSSWSEEQNNIVPLYLFIMYNQMMHAPIAYSICKYKCKYNYNSYTFLFVKSQRF